MPRNQLSAETIKSGGFSLMELLASVTIIGVLAALVVVRTAGSSDASLAATSHAQQGEVELQVQLWRRRFGSFPAADLSDIGLDTTYFPEGLPTCPVDNTGYTIDPVTGRVIGHDH